jgi:hypothetical protein
MATCGRLGLLASHARQLWLLITPTWSNDYASFSHSMKEPIVEKTQTGLG